MIEIFQKNDSQQSFHKDDLSDSSMNWRVMLNHPHAVEFKKAAKVEYQTLIKKKT